MNFKDLIKWKGSRPSAVPWHRFVWCSIEVFLEGRMAVFNVILCGWSPTACRAADSNLCHRYREFADRGQLNLLMSIFLQMCHGWW